MIAIFIKTFKSWKKNDPFQQSAAAAYYAIFSLPSLLILIMTIASYSLDQPKVEAAVFDYIEESLGEQSTEHFNQIIKKTKIKQQSGLGVIIGVLTLVLASTGLFVQLQRSLNRIWQVEQKKSAGLIKFLKVRLRAFAMILLIGLLLILSLSMTTLLNVFGTWLAQYLPHELVFTLQLLNALISFLMTTILFALIFKILPDVIIPWSVSLPGGLVSALLFNIGQHGLNAYFKFAAPGSAFGAAGSLVLVMLWVSYSYMILLFGAELTKIYTKDIKKQRVEIMDIAEKSAAK